MPRIEGLKVEVPECRRCCCCIPLRYGLLTFVYLKLVLSTMFAMFIVYLSIFWIFLPGWAVLFLSVWVSTCFADIGFGITFIVGAHKKNYRIMRVFYYFAIAYIGIITLVILTVMWMYYCVYLTVDGFIKTLVVTTCLYLVIIVIQVYLILLVRSEVLKLKRNCKFEFTNNATDAEANAECHLDVNTANVTSKE